MDQPETSNTPSRKRGRQRGSTEAPVSEAPAPAPVVTQPRRSGRFAAGLALVFATIALPSRLGLISDIEREVDFG